MSENGFCKSNLAYDYNTVITVSGIAFESFSYGLTVCTLSPKIILVIKSQ